MENLKKSEVAFTVFVCSYSPNYTGYQCLNSVNVSAVFCQNFVACCA